MAKEKRASWFKVFRHQRKLIDSASNEEAGIGLKAAMAYFDGEEPPDNMPPFATAVFLCMQQYIDESFSDYERRVENGKHSQA